MNTRIGSAEPGAPQSGRPGLEWIDLARPAMFRRPAYLQASAWLEHLPFAMWVVDAHRPATFVELGTHHGPSYFAFCQAVAEAGLDTSCYAVDTWKGDEHAGFYGNDVHEMVRSYNDTHYSGFSRLVRSTFDEAAAHFTDGSVDLLHIDGLHTLDAVTHDFETWRPKLSDRAVVLFHDINVRERGFGVFKLFERLRDEHPSFWFVHGHGLGVLGVGARQSPALEALYGLRGDPTGLTATREVFARLGRACADAFERGDARKKWLDADAELKQLRARFDQATQKLARGEREAAQVDLLRDRLRLVGELAASERGRLLEQLESFKLRGEEAALQARRLSDASAEAADRLAKQAERIGALETELAESRARAKAQDTRLKGLDGQLDARFSEIALLTRRLLAAENGLSRCRANLRRREGFAQQVESDRGFRILNRLRRLLGRAPLNPSRHPDAEDAETIRRQDALDVEWYLSTYPDVAADGVDPVLHYVQFGAAEGRDPSPRFSTNDYLDCNPDVAEGGMNPLVHYLLHGRLEERSLAPREQSA